MIGHTAGAAGSSGANNVGIGSDTLNTLSTGTNNVAIGHNCGTDITGGDHNIILGSSAGAGWTGINNEFIVGSSSSFISDIYFGKGRDITTADTAGQDITFHQQDGGVATTVGFAGASVTWNLGDGSAGAGVNDNGGAGGGYNFVLGNGGNGGATSGIGGDGGDFLITLSTGGTGDTVGAEGAFIVEETVGTGSNLIEIRGDTIGFFNATPVTQPVHIADPSGGGTQDAEARTAINSILADLAALGLQASS